MAQIRAAASDANSGSNDLAMDTWDRIGWGALGLLSERHFRPDVVVFILFASATLAIVGRALALAGGGVWHETSADNRGAA
jgi:hypothetical protein